MSRDRFDVLERFSPLFEAHERSYEDFLRRRDRRRRNQRITAGVVGIAFFLTAVWFVTTGGSFHHTNTPAAPRPTMVPSDPARVGFIGVPPEGAAPSAPERGELVLSLGGRSTSSSGLLKAWVYSDGRLVWVKHGNYRYGANELNTGFLEQRLTAEGIKLMRSEILATGLFDHDIHLTTRNGVIWGAIQVREGDRLVSVEWQSTDIYGTSWPGTRATPKQLRALDRLDALLAHPTSWLPVSAWKDPEIGAFVPSSFEVCSEGRTRGIVRIASLLPASVGDPLLAEDGCSDVTTEEARALAAALDDAGIERMPDGTEPWTDTEGAYVLSFRRNTVHIWFEPYLPHGEVTCSACG